MALGNVPLVQLTDADANRAQQIQTERLNLLSQVPFLDGRAIESVQLTAGAPVKVPHKLGRAYKGYLITRMRASAIVYDSTSRNFDFYLELTTNVDVTVDVWVY